MHVKGCLTGVYPAHSSDHYSHFLLHAVPNIHAVPLLLGHSHLSGKWFNTGTGVLYVARGMRHEAWPACICESVR